MVLGVCALGVSALYLVPGLGASSGQYGVPAPAADVPGTRPRSAPGPDSASVAARSTDQPEATASTVGYDAAPGESAEPTAARPDEMSPEPVAAPPAAAARPEAARTTQPRSRPSSTPFEAATKDADPPGPVTDLTMRSADPDRVRLAWAPSPGEAGVVAYKVWLNGYEVRSTSETEVTLDWFNDDSTTQVVVVRAVDAAGNQSRTAATLLLTRPEPTTSAIPTPGPSATGGPAAADPPSTEAPAPGPTPSSGNGTT